MKTRANIMNIKALLIAGLTGLATCAQAASIYVDFGDGAGEITASETYNELVAAQTGSTTSLEGTGENYLDLLDTTGFNTGVDLHVLVTSTTGDVRGGGPSSNLHDPITGIDNNALNDGFWVNNGATFSGTVSFTLTFSSLSADAYNIDLTGGDTSNAVDTTWSITTGTGDATSFVFTPTNDVSSVAAWTEVAAVSGEIVIQGTYDAVGQYNTGALNFVSLTAVPEPASFALLGGLLALGAVTLRRRR